MIQNENLERIFFNQNLIYHKDNVYNSNGSLDISISSSTIDYKTFSPPSIHISVIGSNNLRKMCSLNYVNSVDLFMSLKDVMDKIDQIYITGKNISIIKKYTYDKIIKFEFVLVQNLNERVVVISIINSESDFSKVIIPYLVFNSFYVGILKNYISDFLNLSLNLSTRSLLTDLLEQNKMIRNSLTILPSTIINMKDDCQQIDKNEQIEHVMEDLDKFLGKDMENIKIDFNDIVKENNKPKTIESDSLLINKTLTNDLKVLDSMLNSSSTRPDSMICIFEGFRRSMNLDNNFSFLPDITEKDLKSLLYVSKLTHDMYINLYLTKNISIPSSFGILKYKTEKDKINEINIKLSHDLFLISGFIKIFRSKMESKEDDAEKNGSIFYLRIRSFLDPLIYSFIDETKINSVFNKICENFEQYNSSGLFSSYQDTLKEYNLTEITKEDIKEYCNEINLKLFSKGVLNVNINDRHIGLYNNSFLKMNSDNNLSIEQIINEVIPLEVQEKIGKSITEDIMKEKNISKEVQNLFLNKKDKEPKKEQKTNLVKTIEFFKDEIPKNLTNDFIQYSIEIGTNNFDINKFNLEEVGENIVKTIYRWNETENKNELYTDFRSKLEQCLLSKDLILTKYNSKQQEKNNDVWDLELLD